MNPIVKSVLESYSTRHLLELLKEARAYGGEYDFWAGFNKELFGKSVTVDELKEILATREHVPNKLESKKIRQDKAKTRKEARNNRNIRRCK